jgi:hypothetical protein
VACALVLTLVTVCGTSQGVERVPEATVRPAAATEQAYVPLIARPPTWTDCSESGMGSVLLGLEEFDDSTGPELVGLAEDGFTGLIGTPNYDPAAEYFPLLGGWQRGLICNSHQCLRNRVTRAAGEGLAYDYLGYGPERLDGVPPGEKYNLPWATEVAWEIADEWETELMLSYSTTQLHEEADERGFGWENPGAVVELLAPYGDLWLIQAADEYNDPNTNPNHPDPILSQRHYPPGPEWRAEVEKWVTWIRAANPAIEIWIQLALHRIPAGPPPWEDNYPSAELLLEYREWLVNPAYGPPLVDGVYVTSIYSWPIDPLVADQEMDRAIRAACLEGSARGSTVGSPSSTRVAGAASSEPVASPSTEPSADDITLVEEGWTDDLAIEGITVLPGYYYRVYENGHYPCGAEGYHQFMVLDDGPDAAVEKHLFVKFLGGAAGFWYLDGGDRVYYPQENAVGLLNATLNRNWMFRTSVSEEHANGVTRRIREHPGFRIMVPSYCSHDFYHGIGEYDATDGFARYGTLAANEAVDYVQAVFGIDQMVVYGGSAGAAGFFVGVSQENVAGIVMDSQAIDLAAIRDGCIDGHDPFGGAFPCFCPEGGPTCMEGLAPRIGFELGVDEPYRVVERGEVDVPIFLVWNAHDASVNAHYQYDNLHQALRTVNPGGDSVACRVCLPHADPAIPDSCIEDDDLEPLGACNLHVPTAYDFDYTGPLVHDVTTWILGRAGDLESYQVYLPRLVRAVTP